MSLLEQQDFKCALTGDPLTPETAALCYRIPLSRGGAYEPTNAFIATQQVAGMKSTLTVAELVDVARRIVAWAGPEPNE